MTLRGRRLPLQFDAEALARAPQDLPGYRELLAGGWFVELGPALVAGTVLAERSLARMARALRVSLAASGAEEVALPASEGEALVNLLVKTGALAGADGGAAPAPAVFALGTGFREDVTECRGLFGLALYDRLDLAALGPAEGPGALAPRELLAPLRAALAPWGLGHDWPDGEASAPSTPLEAELPAGGRVVLGRLDRRSLGAGAGGRAQHAVLATLDLFALFGVLAERGRDEHGLAWPAGLAPCELGWLAPDGAPEPLGEKLAGELHAAGIDLLVDDRPLPLARRREDCRRWGLPWRVLVGPRAAQGEFLLEARAEAVPERVEAGVLAARVLERLGRSPDAAGAASARDGGAARRRRVLF